MEQSPFWIKFWGVRGSIACPGNEFIRYGGNTPCIEVWCGNRLLILDAGTGINPLGQHLEKNHAPFKTHILLTHTHFDHIIGLPFFKSVYNPQNQIDIWAAHLIPESTLCNAVHDMMNAPFFPIPPEIFGAKMSYNDFQCGEQLVFGDIKIKTFALNHPNRATGYRIEYQGKSLCYMTDTEHKIGKPDEELIAFIHKADVVIYDSTYTDEEFPKKIGWGHSTWQEGLRLCSAAKARHCVFFHHDPSHNDAFLDRVQQEAFLTSPYALVAQEGMMLYV
jgi:phosphoribosyl 1,2-cyclic phosphodiesterase